MLFHALQARKNTNLKKNNCKKNTLVSIPDELLLEIVARVASGSCKDLFNTKLSCKTLNKFAGDEYVFRCISLDEVPRIKHEKMIYQKTIFFDRCYEAGNPEVIYRLGIKQYFEEENKEFGIKFLWRAANLGHPEATYMVGIILILLGGEDGAEAKQKGMKIIGDFKKSMIPRQRIGEIREKFWSILKSYFNWSSKYVVNLGHRRPICCTTHKYKFAALMIHRGWDGYEDAITECEACRCDQEMIHLWEDNSPAYAQHLIG